MARDDFEFDPDQMPETQCPLWVKSGHYFLEKSLGGGTCRQGVV
jgi:hypothetical protein